MNIIYYNNQIRVKANKFNFPLDLECALSYILEINISGRIDFNNKFVRPDEIKNWKIHTIYSKKKRYDWRLLLWNMFYLGKVE